MERLAVEAVAVALGATTAREELAAPLFRLIAGIFVLRHFDILDYAIECTEKIEGRGRISFKRWNRSGSVKNFIYRLFRQILERSVYRKPIPLENSAYLHENDRVLIFSKRNKRSLGYRQFLVGHNLGAVYDIDIAESFTTRAGALRRVKREIMRSRVMI